MRIQTSIDVDVAVHYLDIEGLRFCPHAGAGRRDERLAEFTRIRAHRAVDRDGLGAVYITGHGNWVKKDGTVGMQAARITFGRSLNLLPHEWQNRILLDLQALADKVTVAE